MIIGLDFDDTYTRDPIAWDAFIKLMRSRSHYVYIVTWRNDLEAEEIRHSHLAHLVDGIYATNRNAKAKWMFDNHNTIIDVWIDDNPISITKTMEVLSSGIWV